MTYNLITNIEDEIPHISYTDFLGVDGVFLCGGYEVSPEAIVILDNITDELIDKTDDVLQLWKMKNLKYTNYEDNAINRI